MNFNNVSLIFLSPDDPDAQTKGNIVMFFSGLSALSFYLYQVISEIPKATRRMLQLRGLHVTMMKDITNVRAYSYLAQAKFTIDKSLFL